MSLRRRLYGVFEQRRTASRAARWANRLLAGVILLNVATVILDTLPGLAPWVRQAFYRVEVLSVAVFTVEYLGRLWWCVEDPRYAHPLLGRLRYALSFMALVDLLAILPFYLSLFTETDALLLRLLRVLRLLKLSRYAPAVNVLTAVLREERHSLLFTFFVLLVVLVFAATGIYVVERDAQPEAFGSIPAAMWWAVATLTTVGYGDVTPVTAAGKLFASLVTLSGLAMVSLPAGIIASGFTEQMRLRRELFHDLVLEALEQAGPEGEVNWAALERRAEELGLHRGDIEWTLRRIALRRRVDGGPEGP
ncbi:MAG: ion transporter [Gammaproteobacteria bacterium]|nr:MAG: ion transporter [Gammaproteobacteria bacterium]